MNEVKSYSFNELFELIRKQTEEENKKKGKKPTTSTTDDIYRFLNNPTLQNLGNTIKFNKNKEKDDRDNYTYIQRT